MLELHSRHPLGPCLAAAPAAPDWRDEGEEKELRGEERREFEREREKAQRLR